MWEPFGTAPTNGTASWRSGPNERGTLNILSSCILTLLLCAYTSLHLDIPEHKKTQWTHLWWRRLVWVCIALIAPELIAFIAFRQWLFARKLESQMKELLSSPDVDPKADAGTEANDLESQARKVPKRTHPWTRMHSHFSLMGGFAFDVSKSNTKFLPDDRERVTLMPAALRMLAEHRPDLLPDISEETIQDKSKANSFAKTLVCLQACWFIAQTIGRTATGHATSLLEMNTFLHCVCCLLIYLAWWHKPLDIEEPFVIDASKGDARSICAWMVMSSTIGKAEWRYQDYPGKNGITIGGSSGCVLKYLQDATGSYWNDDAVKRNRAQGRREEVRTSIPKGRALLRVYNGQTVHGFLLAAFVGSQYDRVITSDLDDAYSCLTQTTLNCLEIAGKWRKKNDLDIAWHFRWDEMVRARPPSTAAIDQSLKEWVGSTWVSRRAVSSPNEVVWIGLLIAGGIYGGIHLLAWDAPFPNSTQRLLWIMSCLIIVSPVSIAIVTIPVAFCLMCLCDFITALNFWIRLTKSKGIQNVFVGPWSRFKEWWRPIWETYVATPSSVVIILVGGALCTVSRVFLIVECFINLAHLPDEVFQEPEWSKYIPHFGSG